MRLIVPGDGDSANAVGAVEAPAFRRGARVGGDGAADGGAASEVSVVVRLSAQARALLAGRAASRERTSAAGGGGPARAGEPAPVEAPEVDAELEAPSYGLVPEASRRPAESGAPGEPREPAAPSQPRDAGARGEAGAAGAPADATELTAEQQEQVRELAARDVEVRAHEAAHAAAAGGMGGRPSFDYVTGPDGKRYAVGGEVSIDTSAGRTPEETIARARTIRAAATAPASPSAQDMAVASAAARMEAEARRAINERKQVETQPWQPRVIQGQGGPSAARTAQGGGAVAVERAGGADGATTAGVAASDRNPEHDAEMTLIELRREQISAQGGAGHSHLQTDCGFCRRAVRAYA